MLYVVGDIHWGVRRNSRVFHEILMREIQKLLEVVTEDDSVVFLGDMFDSRSSVDFQILNDAWTFFIKLSRSVHEVFILIGNHDLYYKENKLEYVNCRFLRWDSNSNEIANVHIIHELSEIEVQNKRCLFVPWIDNGESKKNALKMLKDTSYDVVFGHFDSIGIYSDRMVAREEMFDSEKDFDTATLILSGHYHKRCEWGKVKYIGSFINTSYSDAGDVKGFYSIDQHNHLRFHQGESPRFEYVHIHHTEPFIKMIEAISDEYRSKLSKRICGNFIKLIFHEYNPSNEEVYHFIKSFEPVEVSVGYEIEQVDEEVMEEGFDGFNSKANITDVITDFLDKMEDQIPSGIELDELKSIVESSHQKYIVLQEST